MGNGLQPRETLLQYATYRRDPLRRCEFCVHAVFVRPRTDGRPGYSLLCGCPKCLPGQAGRGRDCCSFEREPGADDEIEGLPPLVPW